jgi:succinate dehydrogenase / fumarate reductase cytochrome b subunit
MNVGVSMARPKNIGITDLMQYRFPVTAISSILHRITGVILFIYIPVVLYFLNMSLKSESGFHHVQSCVHQPFGQFFLWLFCASGVYHFFAGVKHLIMDLGMWEHLGTAKFVSWIVILLGVVSAALLGVWIWS